MNLYAPRQALADVLGITRRALVDFGKHECTRRSAALAYYTLFAVFPLLLLSISVLAFMLEAGVPLAVDAQTAVLQAVEQTMPQTRELVEEIIVVTRRNRGGTSLVGLFVLAWSASNMFAQARLALNAIWNTRQPQGLEGVLHLRLRGLAMMVGAGLLLFLFTLANTSLDLVALYATRLPWSDAWWPAVLPLSLFATTVILFAALYRFVPSASLRWSQVWPGAIVGGIGWEVIKKGFVWYAASIANWGAMYGPIAGVIALLFWLYLSFQVLLLGAEFAASYSRWLDEKRAAARVAAAVAGAVVARATSAQAPAPADEPPDAPYARRERGELARGTAVGMVGAGAAGALVLLGLLATGRRLLTQGRDGEE